MVLSIIEVAIRLNNILRNKIGTQELNLKYVKLLNVPALIIILLLLKSFNRVFVIKKLLKMC